MENSEQSFTQNFRITEQIATVCSLSPQKHIRKRTKHHVIFSITDDDVLRQHVTMNKTYKPNSVLEHLLTRTNEVLKSSWCGNVICEIDPQDPILSLSELTAEKTQFCNGNNIITSQVTRTPKFFFVMKSVSSAFTPDLEEDINTADAMYKLSGIVYFNGIHYWCEILSTQIGIGRAHV